MAWIMRGPCVLTRSATPPADLISARLFKTLRSVAMRSYSHLSEDERDQIGVLRACGAVDGRHCPGARSGESHHLPGAAAERTPFERVLAASRRRSLSIAQAA